MAPSVSRVLHARTPQVVNMPQMLKKAIGVDCIEVVETQRLTWGAGANFTVSSEPALNVGVLPCCACNLNLVRATLWQEDSALCHA